MLFRQDRKERNKGIWFCCACSFTVHALLQYILVITQCTVQLLRITYSTVDIARCMCMPLLLMSFRYCTGCLAVVNAICYFTVHMLHCDLFIYVIAYCMTHFCHGASHFLYIHSFVITRCMVLLYLRYLFCCTLQKAVFYYFCH